MKRTQARHELMRDLLLIFVGVCITFFLSSLGIIDVAISYIGNTALASFTAGIFFTSAFTIAPASVALAHIAKDAASIHEVALWGALGAMCGDLILFLFIRDHFADDFMNSFRPKTVKKVMSSFHTGLMRWFSPVLGALIIASPLPDEFGVTLLGLSKVRVAILMPIAFIMNALGIYGLIWFTGIV